MSDNTMNTKHLLPASRVANAMVQAVEQCGSGDKDPF